MDATANNGDGTEQRGGGEGLVPKTCQPCTWYFIIIFHGQIAQAAFPVLNFDFDKVFQPPVN